MPDTLEATATPAEPTPAPVTLEAAAEPARPLTATAPARTAPVSALTLLAERMTEARLTGQAGAFLSAALADVKPSGNGAGNESAGLMTQALGELWSGVEYDPVYSPLIASGVLTGTKATGWRWSTEPAVADYAGNKTAVPSNAAKLELVEAVPARIAGAHDIDRIYRDLGDAAVLASYWRLMAESIRETLDARARAAIVATAGTPTAGGAGSTTLGLIVRGALKVQGDTGARATFALVSSDLVEKLAETPQSSAPIGLPGLSLPSITPAPGLNAKTVIVGVKQAIRQLTFSPPVRVEAVNIPNGGIDAGLFSYSAELTEKSAGVVAYTTP